MADGGGSSLTACTIVARNYVPAARVLAASYLEHHPDSRFLVLVVDALRHELPGLAGHGSGAELLDAAALDVEPAEFARMAAAYTVTELCTALKPSLLNRALESADAAVYLDPDIEVYARLPGLAERAVGHGIVLTPHVLQPMPRDGLRPTEADIMAAGVFNLGFIAVSRAARDFLEFWRERLRTDAISAPDQHLFTDQRWVDNVPALYPHCVITDPGWNVAYWNVYQRQLGSAPDGTLTAAGQPLRFFHFSGYRPESPWLLTSHFADRPRVLLSEHPEIARLCRGYRRRLVDEGYAETVDAVAYRWNTLADGTRLSPAMRRAFRAAWVAAERDGVEPPPSPFGEDPDAFLRWATSPSDPTQRRAGTNRWAMAVWSSRPDLQQVFPQPLGTHAEAYRLWCAEDGIAEGHVHPDAVPGPVRRDPVPITRAPGANVLGYLTAELGVGELGRLVHQAVASSGLPVATVVEDSTVVNRTGHPLPAQTAAGLPHHPVTVLCVNADMTATTLDLHPDLAEGRYVIGVWSWELEEFPAWMHEAFERVDEIWTISEFCRRAIAAHSPVPVYTFPVPVRAQPIGPPGDHRDGPRFLFAFDHNSVFERKNPLGVITAFQRAFPSDEIATLVIKSINGDRHPVERERLRAAACDDPRIELVEHYLAHREVSKLFASVDCYVSLHRSEGFGLTVAEAMAHGLPVIATNHSGSTEVLPATAGWLVPARPVAVGPGHHPYPPNAYWADPDLEVAAGAMRAVAADRQAAARRGAAGRAHLVATRTPEAAARWVATRLTAAFETWQNRSRTGLPQDGPAAQLQTAREALRWRADTAAPSRLPLAPTLRRAVLRAVDHYDHHQRTVLAAVLDSVEAAVTASHEQTTARLNRLEANHDTAIERAERARQDDALAARLDDLAATVAQRHDALDHKVIDMLRQRDERLGALDATAGELRSALTVLRTAVLREAASRDGPSPPAGSEPVLTDVGLLWLPAADTVVLPWLREYGTWERIESALIDRLLFPGATFLDIGAHVGYYTVRALHRVGPAGSVVAVEPWSRVRDLLDHNVRSTVPAGLLATLTVLPEAAWDSDGPLRLRAACDGNSGDSRIDPTGTEPVRGVRLDEVPAVRDRAVHVVKVDAQGRDHRALAGLLGVLARDRPNVVCEFSPAGIQEIGDDPEEVLSRYTQWGYRVEPVTGETGPGLQWRRADLLRLAAESSQDFITLWLRPAGCSGG